jgi:hypothetical protein
MLTLHNKAVNGLHRNTQVFPFDDFRLAIVLSVLLRFKDSDYLFSIFKLFFVQIVIITGNK